MIFFSFVVDTDLSSDWCYSYVDISIDIAIAIAIAIAIPQSVQTQKVVTNSLVYLVYGYYNSSTMKEVERAFLVILVFCCFLVLR
jgi:hypothetical protein